MNFLTYSEKDKKCNIISKHEGYIIMYVCIIFHNKEEIIRPNAWEKNYDATLTKYRSRRRQGTQEKSY